MFNVKIYALELTNEGSFETLEQAEQWLHSDGLTAGAPPSKLGLMAHPDTYKVASIVEESDTPSRRIKLHWLHRNRPPKPYRRVKEEAPG